MLVHGHYPNDTRVRRQAECLAEGGFEVYVVALKEKTRQPRFEVINEVFVYRMPLRKKRGNKIRYFFEFTVMTLFSIWKLAFLHLKKKFDVIHVNNMPDFLIIAGLIPRLTGAVLVLDVHDPMSELFQETYQVNETHLMIRLLKWQEWISYRLANHLVTVNDPMAENVAKKRGCPKETVKIVHNFPDLKVFPICEDKTNWPNNRKSFVLLYSGTVTEHYRLDIAVRAIAKVSQDIPNIRFRILGRGSSLQRVLDLAKDLGISDKVEHLESVDIDMVKNIIVEADVGISTHQSGVFGNLYFSTKIIEFMTQGLPVISSRTLTIEKYIPEDSIFYFEPEQVEDLAKQILLVHNNPAIVLEKIRNSKKLLSRYNWEEESRRFLALYGDLMKSN